MNENYRETINLLMTLIVRFFGEPQIKRGIPSLVTQTHIILSLTGTLVSSTMLITTMLTSTTFLYIRIIKKIKIK